MLLIMARYMPFLPNTCFTFYCILEKIEKNTIYIKLLTVNKNPDLLMDVLFVQWGDREKEHIAYSTVLQEEKFNMCFYTLTKMHLYSFINLCRMRNEHASSMVAISQEHSCVTTSGFNAADGDIGLHSLVSRAVLLSRPSGHLFLQQ